MSYFLQGPVRGVQQSSDCTLYTDGNNATTIPGEPLIFNAFTTTNNMSLSVSPRKVDAITSLSITGDAERPIVTYGYAPNVTAYDGIVVNKAGTYQINTNLASAGDPGKIILRATFNNELIPGPYFYQSGSLTANLKSEGVIRLNVQAGALLPSYFSPVVDGPVVMDETMELTNSVSLFVNDRLYNHVFSVVHGTGINVTGDINSIPVVLTSINEGAYSIYYSDTITGLLPEPNTFNSTASWDNEEVNQSLFSFATLSSMTPLISKIESGVGVTGDYSVTFSPQSQVSPVFLFINSTLDFDTGSVEFTNVIKQINTTSDNIANNIRAVVYTFNPLSEAEISFNQDPSVTFDYLILEVKVDFSPSISGSLSVVKLD